MARPNAQIVHAPAGARPAGIAAVGTELALLIPMRTTAVRKILVPVDFSSCSRVAFEFALGLAASLGASLEVLHVRQPGEVTVAGVDENAAAKEELHRFVTASGGGTGSMGERIVAGDARESIVGIAEKEG